VRKTIDELRPAEARTLARIRLAVTAHLAALAGGLDPELRTLAGMRPFLLELSAPGLPPAFIWSTAAGLSAFSGGERPRAGLPSLVLRFGSTAACAKLLSGGKGAAIPFPLGLSAPVAFAFFKAAAARAPAMLADPATPAEIKARLLAEAALRGIAALGGSDPALAERLAHVPDGTVSVDAPAAFSLGLAKRGAAIFVLDAVPEKPNARLSFRDAAAAVSVFSGKRPAVLALGSGEVAIGGLIPLVQGLFAVLDRLGDYLAVKHSKEGAR
jgi:hypothetical protein